MIAPRVLLVTALDVVPEGELAARLDRLARLAPEACARVAVQLRDPDLPVRELLALGRRLRAQTRALGVALVVNDRLDLARALAADGVHLGRRSVEVADARAWLGVDAWISVACHGEEDVERAARAGADGVLLSPIFASPGKGTPLGLDALGRARARLASRDHRPAIFALGGVDAARAQACLDAGADGVAAIRADLGDVLSALVARGRRD